MDGKSPFCTKEVERGGKELERVGLLVRLFLYPYLCIVFEPRNVWFSVNARKTSGLPLIARKTFGSPLIAVN